MKVKLIIFSLIQILIVIIMLINNQSLGLIPYINTSFLFGATLVFIGLVVYVFSKGFFDIFTMSMRKVFTPKRYLEDVTSMRSPSELFDFPYIPLFQIGGTILLCMSIALFIYYLQ
ncbi:DUF3899 domain-containing protein [Paenisporosarcina sp. TG20]|uniref:DUF3899 domain-containing protein n=1 Tax=Paenisporosarcina sp. TG20 TaxID=1211706 RepID=UPI00036051B7|nr:DUF3899 domain-containing protein [Paenisporosarcina sp. TG20]